MTPTRASPNITRIRDLAQAGVYFDNAYADPTQSFTYDPLYRLIAATGREHDGLAQPTAAGFAPIAHPQDTQAQRNYLQTYTYDPVGNILRMKHVSGGVTVWHRGYDYAQDGNRLLATSLPGDDVDDPQTYSDTYAHDVHGSMTAMPSIPGGLTWDPQDRLQKTDHQGGGVTYYVYDSAGMRVRKVHLNQAATTAKERYYLGPWETYRETTDLQGTPTLDLERETLHVHTPAGAVVLLETKILQDATALQNPTTHHRYQHSNHLGTATLELSEDAEVITYEEYHPYGTSSYRAANAALDVSPKRYRYTGKERDEETGLYYHEARYYGCWLGRWTAADPIGLQGGINRFAYANNNPLTFTDPSGTTAAASAEVVEYFTDPGGQSGMIGVGRSTPAPDSPVPEGREIKRAERKMSRLSRRGDVAGARLIEIALTQAKTGEVAELSDLDHIVQDPYQDRVGGQSGDEPKPVSRVTPLSAFDPIEGHEARRGHAYASVLRRVSILPNRDVHTGEIIGFTPEVTILERTYNASLIGSPTEKATIGGPDTPLVERKTVDKRSQGHVGAHEHGHVVIVARATKLVANFAFEAFAGPLTPEEAEELGSELSSIAAEIAGRVDTILDSSEFSPKSSDLNAIEAASTKTTDLLTGNHRIERELRRALVDTIRAKARVLGRYVR